MTYRLYGSIPFGWQPRGTGGHAFADYDRMLDLQNSGPTWLQRPDIAQMVGDAIVYGATTLARYDLFAWAVMPNHVHILIETTQDLSQIMKTLKGYTAREANKLLARTGQFWQHESFDHWVRNEQEFRRLARYIENNPVKARLVVRPEDYRWSSVFSGISRQACALEGKR